MSRRVHRFRMAPLAALALAAVAVAADGPAVPPELLGKWASTAADCTLNGKVTLSINETTVEFAGVRGHIVAGATAGNREIEVLFETASGGASAKNVRMYTLSTDGLRLLELRGGHVVASRVRCEVPLTTTPAKG